MKIGFDNDKYLSMQSEHIKERIGQFGDKLYLEFGGKLFDDYHASRVLPGFAPDSKLRMLLQLADQAEVVIVISAADIEKSKVRHDLGITYDVDVLRLIQEFQGKGLYVGSVVITQYSGQSGADQFKMKLEHMGIRVYRHYCIEGYPSNIPLIVSDEGYGKNDYIETSRPLVVITAPGPGSGKMATTADLNDVNMIDPFHLEAYGKTTVNYNRDVDIFPVLNAIFEGIYGSSPYKSPTDMGVNMAGFCICDDEVCCEASKQEIIRRSQQIGTYEISSQTAPDCCTLFMPRRPETHARMRDIHEAWESFDHEAMVADLVEHMEYRDYSQCPSYHAPKGRLRAHHSDLAPIEPEPSDVERPEGE